MPQLLTPSSLADALEMLEAEPAARPLAGGVAVLQRARLGEPPAATYVELGRLPELTGIGTDGDALKIGALATLAEIAASPAVIAAAPLLAAAASSAASPGVRSIASIGGNLIDAPGSSDPAAALLALDASVVLAYARERRTLALASALRGGRGWVPDRGLLVAVTVPPVVAHGWAFHRLPLLGAADASVATLAIAHIAGDGRVQQSRAWATAVAERPLRLTALEAGLAGRRLAELRAASSGEQLRRLADRGVQAADVLSDRRASAWYRRTVLAELAGRAVRQAAERLPTQPAS